MAYTSRPFAERERQVLVHDPRMGLYARTDNEHNAGPTEGTGERNGCDRYPVGRPSLDGVQHLSVPAVVRCGPAMDPKRDVQDTRRASGL